MVKEKEKDEVILKLLEHDKRFDEHDKRFDEHDKRFDRIEKRLDEHDKLFDRIIKKLIEHDERFERIEERLDQMVTREEYLRGYDEMMVILKRLDQERIFTAEWVRRIETKVEKHDQEIIKIKQALNIK